MRSLFKFTTFAVLMMVATTTMGQDATADKSKLETDAKERTPADQVNFSSELQVPLQALAHLGKTIEEARDEADPVCIASAANILAAAESMAGDKKASVTSEQLWDEAIKLAEMRNSSAELAALAKLSSGERSTDLMERSEAAKGEEEAEKEAEEAGETSRELDGELHVINRSHEYIHLYVNGQHFGDIAPHGSREFHLHHAYHLVGRSRYHQWHEDIRPHVHHWDWVLNDPHH
ncbi:hypothetical protein [Rhodopirellula sp. SWK7]|uniref:hypothetical protein n=1 Tax=Rhodopirellula sp. SWK7 TaxID=595460 RepID=UPI0002BE6E0E|nr:hypothetical protein [Rhodopirellula sp. SWK7]EMI44941.1 secreted protein [Rhodopirellula sp. SWK7]